MKCSFKKRSFWTFGTRTKLGKTDVNKWTAETPNEAKVSQHKNVGQTNQLGFQTRYSRVKTQISIQFSKGYEWTAAEN
jgi:hypothetical protein